MIGDHFDSNVVSQTIGTIESKGVKVVIHNMEMLVTFIIIMTSGFMITSIRELSLYDIQMIFKVTVMVFLIHLRIMVIIMMMVQLNIM